MSHFQTQVNCSPYCAQSAYKSEYIVPRPTIYDAFFIILGYANANFATRATHTGQSLHQPTLTYKSTLTVVKTVMDDYVPRCNRDQNSYCLLSARDLRE